VTGEVMKAACDLARWFGAEAMRIYNTLAETDEQREQRKLVEFIEKRGGAATVRDVTHYYWSLKGQTDKAEQALNALLKAGYGSWDMAATTPKGGRPTRKFQLLQASPSPKPCDSRGEQRGYGDGDGAPLTDSEVNTHDTNHD
jgi:hypothetical protein